MRTILNHGSRGDRCAPLSALRPGQAARLCAPHGEGAVLPARMLDLGFVPGTPLRVVRRAPFGDPIEVEIRGYRICLRHGDVRDVCVIPEG